MNSFSPRKKYFTVLGILFLPGLRASGSSVVSSKIHADRYRLGTKNKNSSLKRFKDPRMKNERIKGTG